MSKPVCRLKKALCGHPDAGTDWEHKCGKHVREVGFEPGGEERPPKRAKRLSAAPPPLALGPCYGSCSKCNHCKRCRERTCNGPCRGCNGCKKRRTWGERLQANDTEAVAIQAAEVTKPPVEARPYGKTGEARRAITEAGPKDAPSGSTPCTYCRIWLPPYRMQNCPDMPDDVWIKATKARQISKFGDAAVNSWPIQCQHCAQPFPTPASKRVHLAG